MNPANFILNMIRSGGNPQQIMLQYLQQQNNPMYNQLLPLAQNGDSKGMEEFARQVCAKNGVDFDKEFKAFKQQFGFK